MPNISYCETELSNTALGIHHFAVTIDGVGSTFIAWCIKNFLEQQLQAQVVAAYDKNKHAAYFFYRLIDR